MAWGDGFSKMGKLISPVRASGKVSYSMLPKRPICGGLTKDNPTAINLQTYRSGVCWAVGRSSGVREAEGLTVKGR
jgi:hypothetical protein